MSKNRISAFLAPARQNRISSYMQPPAGLAVIPVNQLPAAFQASLALHQQLYRLAYEQAVAKQVAELADWLSQ